MPKYDLVVKQGEEITEAGYLFIARPFSIIIDGKSIDIVFDKDADFEVQYSVRIDGQELFRLEHQDYIPIGHEPGDVAAAFPNVTQFDIPTFFAALVRAGIVTRKGYVKYFQSDENKSNYSFEIHQA